MVNERERLERIMWIKSVIKEAIKQIELKKSQTGEFMTLDNEKILGVVMGKYGVSRRTAREYLSAII